MTPISIVPSGALVNPFRLAYNKGMKRSVILIVLDGWGIGEENESNPVHVVKPKNLGWLAQTFPVTSLQASGISVGLPWGEVGNSEVGHLTLGAGKVIYQYYPRITLAIRDRSFFENQALKTACLHAKKNNSALNLVGLLSKGNVHAALEHIEALVELGKLEGVGKIRIHLFSDGMDSAPRSLRGFLEALPRDLVANLVGRYYGMDRNGNWQLTQVAYDLMTQTKNPVVKDPAPIIESTYGKELTEEYLPPMRLLDDSSIQDNDALIFFNFREDSIRQLSEAFIQKDFDKFPVKKFENLHIATMTRYEERFSVPVAFPPDHVESPLGKVLGDNGKTQLRLAETYKYAHVTYFFNGHLERPFKNEYRVLIPSISSPKPEEHPEMMASTITDRLIQAIETQGFDFVLVNYANSDTIAHTSNYQAALKAVEIVDGEIGRILKVGLNDETIIAITSDHGNIERVLNPLTGLPESQHDPSPVPFYLIGSEFKHKKFANWKTYARESSGALSDVAPTILELMGVAKPPEMTGRSLLSDLV
ncbi:2,3-bisphosphoglycerate-independent phosphoglycerate mutase [Candidatus Parcubacteria bacterium]|nr:MAG: 2,3-bisphosphoglycerate-independent phosphoglycerate mutase [Candidatus Parcubacteria bacterium]